MIGVSNSAPREPGVGQGEGAPAELVGRHLVGAGALGQVGDLLRQSGQVEVAGAVDDRHQQPALGVDGDAQVDAVVVGDRAGVLVDAGVDDRVLLERLEGGLREERHEAELGALALLERGLGLLAQPGDLRDVDLDDGGELRADLQRLDHALGDHLAQAAHLLGLAAHGGVGRGLDGLVDVGGRRCGGLLRPGLGRLGAAGVGGVLGLGRLRRGGRLLLVLPAAGLPGGVQHVLLADPPADAVPCRLDRSTPCSAASLRTSGVT
jgi:hypothetical protein